MFLKETLHALNIRKKCAEFGVGLWQCPHFLFPVMGLIIIIAIVTTHFVALRFAEPEISALIVLVVSMLLFIVGNAIVKAFESVAEAAKLKSEFISIVSHEMRSPISAIKWQLDLVSGKENNPGNTAEFKNVLNDVWAQNQKMLRLVNSLLEVSKIQDKSLKLDPSEFSLKEATQKVIKNYANFSEASNVSIELNAPEKFMVYADPKKTEMVIEQLIDNAIRYSRGRGSVYIFIKNKGRDVFLSVNDEGAGIPEKESDMIFGLFFRSHNVFRYRTGGLGLGLYLVKSLVEASKGKVGFKSVEGKGSEFWFTLPSAGGGKK